MFVLDTNVISELMGPAPNYAVTVWTARQATATLFTTAISEAELRHGVEILPKGRRRDALDVGVERMLAEGFTNRILPFDSEAARVYAVAAAARRCVGLPISQADCQIAAIASARGMAVATRNVPDFAETGVEVVNPWTYNTGS